MFRPLKVIFWELRKFLIKLPSTFLKLLYNCIIIKSIKLQLNKELSELPEDEINIINRSKGF